MGTLRWSLLLLLPLFSEGGRLSQQSSPAACTFSAPSPIHLAVSTDASIDTLIYRSTVSPANAQLSLATVTSTKLPHINYTHRFDLVKDEDGEFEIKTRARLSLPPYPSEITSANLYLAVLCNDQVFPLITLRLDGGNRVAPRFYGLPYAVTLPRKSPIGTEVNTGIIAIDWDPAPAYGVHFSIMDDWAPFSLVVRPVSSNSPSLSLPLQGWLTDQFPPQIRLKVMGSIDHLPNEFDLTIMAIDNGEPAKSNSTKIHVNLIGDYRPLVRDSRVRTVIGEASGGDTLLVIPSIQSVVDEEVGPVSYSIVERKMKDFFSIDASTGILTLLSQPPLSIKSLGIMVTSTENPPRSSIIEVTLLRDLQFPRFSSCDFSVSLPENSPPGTHVFQMNVIDRSEGTRIRLIDPDETFALDKETGVVTVQDPTILDSERFDLVQFVLEIETPFNTPAIPPNICQKARVTVHLIDENDNEPLFDQTQYRIRVISPLPNNTLLRSIRAEDNDKGEGGRVDYRLLDADNLPIRLISSNGTAELIYSQRPNTRPLVGRYYVTLEAVDRGVPQRFGRAIIEIEADDLSGLETELEKKLREQDRLKKKKIGEKKVAKVADHSMRGTTESTTEKITKVVPSSTKRISTTITPSTTTKREELEEESLDEEEGSGEIEEEEETTTSTTTVATTKKKTTSGATAATTKTSTTAATKTTKTATTAATATAAETTAKPKTTPIKTTPVRTTPAKTTPVVKTTTEKIEEEFSEDGEIEEEEEEEETTTEKIEKKEEKVIEVTSRTLPPVKIQSIEKNEEVEEEGEEEPIVITSVKKIEKKQRRESSERKELKEEKKEEKKEKREERKKARIVLPDEIKKVVVVEKGKKVEKKKEDLELHQNEEIVSRFHRDEVVTPVRKIFSFLQPIYSIDLFGDFKEGEIIGRVSASPDALFYGMEKRAADFFKVDGDTGDIMVHSEAERLKKTYNFTVSSTNGEFTTESLVSIRVDKTRSLFDSTPVFDQSVYTIHIKENEQSKILDSLRAYHRGLNNPSSSLIYSLLDDGTNVPFYLDEKSGQLVLLAPFDYEKTKELDFKASACLSSNPSSCGYTQIRILVDDVNDNAPVFEKREIDVKLPSDLPKGSTVATFKATDRDSKENGEISYSINPPSNTFAIDIDNGVVITLGPLEHAHYEMAIQAFDHGSPRRSDIGRLTVTVQGTNPSAPQFDQFRYDVTLTGPVKTGEQVVSLHASDPDPGDEGIISYRFAPPKNSKESRDQSRFSMNPHTGAVTTLRSLNSFDGPFLFVVEAVDHSKDFPRKAETLLRIRIEGEPALRFFSLPSTLFISDNKKKGSVILRASASSSEGTPITFSLSPPSDSFEMDGANLIVTKSLESKEHNITIRAETEDAVIEHSLHLVVMTNRDKYPVFSRLIFDLPISLDASFPTTLHTFSAQVNTGFVEYSLFPPKNVPVGLKIDKHTGELVASEEFISSSANTDTVFTVVRAWNSEYPQFHSDVGVIISIESPSLPFGFPLSLYRTIVQENTPVGTLLNSSVSIAPKSQRTGVEYGITPSNIIGIHSNGSLYVTASIDLEGLPVDEEGTLTYTIWAESGDERAVSSIKVKVANVNEFTPVFREKTFRFNVNENDKPGKLLGRIVASDADFGERLIYSMKSASRAESIEITAKGEVLIGKGGIDYDTERAFDLVVSVEDSTGKSDEATVEIVIIPDEKRVTKVENDSPIIWNISPDSLTALPINAIDSNEKDSIQFKIMKGNERGFFVIERVNKTSVLLKPVAPLPSPSTFSLTIEAIDSTKISSTRIIANVLPSPSTTSLPPTTTSIRVPLFSQSEYAKALKDDTPVGTALISVQVWSPPQDGDIQLTSNCSFLNIHKNGVVLLSTPLPLQTGEIDCDITATNDASSTSVPFHLLILDSSASNHAPIFDRSTYNFSISVDSFASMIGKINVHDEDGDAVTLEIQPPEYNTIFDINEQNELELRFPASTLTDQNVFSFIIVASDDGKPKQTAIANVKVFVVNNGKKGGFFPIASSASTNSLINPIPTSLTSLSTPNSTESLEEKLTTVEVTTQTVELVTNDFTTITPTVEKEVEVKNTSEGVKTEEEVESTVKSVQNEIGEEKEDEEEEEEEEEKETTTAAQKLVKFSKKEYLFDAKKDDRVGTIIGSVKIEGASDLSSYEFMVGDDRVVGVNGKGEIYLNGPVIPSPHNTPVIILKDGLILDQAELVIAYPSSSSTIPSTPSSTPSTTTLSKSTKSHPPKSSPSSSSSSSSSSSTHPTTIIMASTTVRVISSTLPSTILQVEGGTTPLDTPSVSPSTTALPHFSFSHSLYTASMPEGEYKNGALVPLQPTIIHTNGKDVTFAIVNPEETPFVINESTGELTIFRVDREEKKEYDLDVTAFDHSSNEQSTAAVHVDIIDVNDNEPVFITLPSIIGVRRDVSVGSVIGHVSAVDSDEGKNGEVSYSIEPPQFFAIDQKKGSIIVRSSLLSIPQDQLTLTVIASDGGISPLKTESEMELRLFSSIQSPTLPRSSSISIPSSSRTVANLLASPNIGDQQSMTYSLDTTHNGLFDIDANGVLSVSRPPLSSEVNVEHKIKVTAKNSYGVDSTLLTVTLIDVTSPPALSSPSSTTTPSSSSSPSRVTEKEWESGVSTVTREEGKGAVCMFPVREYRIDIKENLPSGTPVITVISDCGERGEKVRYSIAVHSVDFSVDQDSGEIRTIRPLDREEKSIHLLVLNVTRDVTRRSERGTEAEESLEALRSRLSVYQTVVIIRVIDENDSIPEWKHLNGEGKLVTSMDWKTPAGAPLLRIHATDKDEKKNRLRYSIEGDISAFSINETSGLIYLQKSVENESKDKYEMTGMVTDGKYESRVPIEIYRLSTVHHLVKLTSEMRHVDIDAKKLEAEINNKTTLHLHILSKQPFVDSNGNVDPKKSYLYVYALDDNNVPRRSSDLLRWMSPHSAVLYQTSGKISNFVSARPPVSLSLADLVWIVVAIICLVLLFIICCISCSMLKRRRLRELEKQYMVDGMRPRPYDVENIPRSTAQTVLSSRRLADTIPDEDRTSNRSDTTFVFANSVKDESSLRRSGGRSAKVQDSTLH